MDVANNLSFNNGQAGIVVGADGGVTDDNTIVSNNIVRDNQNWGIREIGQTGTHNQYLNNLLYHNANGGFLLQNGNTDVNTLTVDPQFVNYQLDGSGDYHLVGKSTAIDSGTSIGAPAYDLDGNPRPQGGGFDRGVYEYIDKIAPTVSITNPVNGSKVKGGSKVTITAKASDDVSVTKVEFSINGTLLCTVMTTPYSCLWTVPGKVGATYAITARAYDASGNTALVTIKVTVVP